MTQPGSVAAAHPPPSTVTTARDLVSRGVSRSEAIDSLAAAAAGQADVLRRGVEWWVRRMPKARWDDYSAVHVLAVLEGALARVEPLTPARGRRTG